MQALNYSYEELSNYQNRLTPKSEKEVAKLVVSPGDRSQPPTRLGSETLKSLVFACSETVFRLLDPAPLGVESESQFKTFFEPSPHGARSNFFRFPTPKSE